MTLDFRGGNPQMGCTIWLQEERRKGFVLFCFVFYLKKQTNIQTSKQRNKQANKQNFTHDHFQVEKIDRPTYLLHQNNVQNCEKASPVENLLK